MHVAQSGIFAIQADRDEEQAVSVGLFIRRLTESPKARHNGEELRQAQDRVCYKFCVTLKASVGELFIDSIFSGAVIWSEELEGPRRRNILFALIRPDVCIRPKRKCFLHQVSGFI